MNNIASESLFTVLLFIQAIHSLEELSTGFHKKWWVMHVPFWAFLLFEILFFGFWSLVLVQSSMPYREMLIAIFNILMLFNGMQHIVWAALKRKYVPGLITAPFFIVVFLIGYFS